MFSSRPRWLTSAQTLFLAGVVLLIVRNNSYPWPVRRASDILFALAAGIVLGAALLGRQAGAWPKIFYRVRWGLGLIAAGLIIATVWSYFRHGLVLESGGWFTILRFAEDFAIFGLAGFFQMNSSGFIKKVALAQLSTLVYVYGLLGGNAWAISNQMARFSFLENWPSTVSYHLLVSLALLMTWLMLKTKTSWSFWLVYITGSALAGIMLWTQSRAAWLGIVLMISLGLFLCRKFLSVPLTRLFGYGVLIAGLFVLGFMFLPRVAQNLVVLRVFPELQSYINIHTGNPGWLLETAAREKVSPMLSESSRPYLWREYLQKAGVEPLGLGVSYFPTLAASYGGVPREPHNTPLETWALGGILAVIGWFLILAKAIQNVWKLLPETAGRFWAFYLLLSLVGLGIAFFFDNMVNFRLFWVIAGIATYLSAENLRVDSLPARLPSWASWLN